MKRLWKTGILGSTIRRKSLSLSFFFLLVQFWRQNGEFQKSLIKVHPFEILRKSCHRVSVELRLVFEDINVFCRKLCEKKLLETSLLRVNVRIFARCCFCFPLVSLKLTIVAKQHRQTACCKKLHFFFRRICAEDGRKICFCQILICFPAKQLYNEPATLKMKFFTRATIAISSFWWYGANLKSLFICVFSFRLFQQKLWLKGNLVQEHQNLTTLGI